MLDLPLNCVLYQPRHRGIKPEGLDGPMVTLLPTSLSLGPIASYDPSAPSSSTADMTYHRT
jgi:hypothetical protein